MNAHLAKIAVSQIIIRDEWIFYYPTKTPESGGRGRQRKTPQNPVFGIKCKFTQRFFFAKKLAAQNAAKRGAGADERRNLASARGKIERKLRLPSRGTIKKPEAPVQRALMPTPAAQKMVVHTSHQRAEEIPAFI